MNERLKQFIDFLGVSTRNFEQKISVSNGLIGRFLSKNTTIQSDVLSKICYTYPELNPEWLITGRGEMLRSQVQNVNGHHNTATMNGDIHQSTGDNDTQRLDSLLEANRKLIDQHAELIRQQGELIEIIKSMTKDTLPK